MWAQLQDGSILQLKAEPNNKYDKDAVEIYWQAGDGQNYKLGYLPRKQNYAVRQLLQKGQQQVAVGTKIVKCQNTEDPWQKVEVVIYLQGLNKYL